MWASFSTAKPGWTPSTDAWRRWPRRRCSAAHACVFVLRQSARRIPGRGGRLSDIPAGRFSDWLRADARGARWKRRAWTSPAATAAAAARRPISSRCARMNTLRSSTSARRTCGPCQAPRTAAKLMGFDEKGHCFMFANGGMLYLRASSRNLPHLRLPRVHRRRHERRPRQVRDQRAHRELALRISHRPRPRRASGRHRGGEFHPPARDPFPGRPGTLASQRGRRARGEEPTRCFSIHRPRTRRSLRLSSPPAAISTGKPIAQEKANVD